MRAIDGDALIDKYGDWYTEEGTEEGYIGTIKGIVDSMPAIEPDLKWIPCSVRLPESIKPVIITWRNNDPKSYYQYIVGKPFIGTGHYCKGKWFWYSSTCEDLLAEYGRSDVDEVDEAIEVIAWQPLPEPYKEENE